MNERAAEILGRKPEELIGSVEELANFHVLDPRGKTLPLHELPGLRALHSGKSVRDEILGFRQPDGGVIWVSAFAEPLIRDTTSHPSAVLISLRPVTRMESGEDPLGKYREWLRWAARIREVFEFESDPVRSIRSCMELMARAAEASSIAYLGFHGGLRSGLLELKQFWDESEGFRERAVAFTRIPIQREPFRDWLAVLRMAEVLEISSSEVPADIQKAVGLGSGDHLILGFLSASRMVSEDRQPLIAMIRPEDRGSFNPFELDIFRLILSSIANEMSRLSAEAVQKRQMNLFRRLFRVAPLVIAVMELKGDTLSVVEISNARGLDFANDADLSGSTDAELGYSQEICEMRRAAARRSMKEGRPLRIEYEREQGQAAGWEEATFSYLDSHHRSHYFSVAVRDITREKLEQQQKDQKQKLEAMGRFTSAIAHDLNNLLQPPLIYVQESMDLLQELELPSGMEKTIASAAPDIAGNAGNAGNEGNVPNEGRLQSVGKKLRITMDSLSRSRQLVRRLLAFTRRGGRSDGRTEIRSSVLAVLDSYGAALPENVRLERQVSERSGYVALEESAVEQILVNLVRNSVLALEERGGLIRVILDGVRKGQFRITVEDNGPGIPRDRLQKIFEPFFSGRKEGTSLGLGLSIVQSIVQEVEGTIEVESEPGRGTSMHVYLPEVTGPALLVNRPASGSSFEERWTFWIVDDDPMVALAVESGLSRLGQKVQHFSDPDIALEALRSGPAPDVLVLDQVLGSRRGADYAPRFRRRISGRIIMVSGNPDMTAEEATAMGIDALLTKPVFPDELLAAVLDLKDTGDP